MNIDLTITELYMIEQLLEQEVNFCNEEPEQEEEIKDQIKPYNDLLDKLKKVSIEKKVVIEVLGGVADCTYSPEGVEVEIIDHDSKKAG